MFARLSAGLIAWFVVIGAVTWLMVLDIDRQFDQIDAQLDGISNSLRMNAANLKRTKARLERICAKVECHKSA